MICAVIKGPSLLQAYAQLQEAQIHADMIECRLDYFDTLEGLEILLSQTSLPVILTLRSRTQGGEFKGTEEERLKFFTQLLELKPTYIDFECTISPLFIDFVRGHYPNQKIISSYHDFKETPLDLTSLLALLKKIPADIYKLALKAHSSLDAFRLIHFAQEHHLLGISMGEYGEISRILPIHEGEYWTYAALDDTQSSAPGQLTLDACKNIYQTGNFLLPKALYGLIGDPVSQSIGHYIHNGIFRKLNIPATYVKIPLKTHELPAFFAQARQRGFRGLSVTMPHKESVFPFLHEVEEEAQQIGAVNTLVFREASVFGANTDGKGALNAIERRKAVQDKKMVIIGAGGAAKAIAYEATKRGAKVKIICRETHKIERWAALQGVEVGNLKEFTNREDYAILINATPLDSLITSRLASLFIPGTLAMDITTFPQETLFLKEAQRQGCLLIFGYEMFLDQAAQQLIHWFGRDQEFFKCGFKVGRHFNLFT